MCHNIFLEAVIPKQTFYNLDEKKKKIILNAAQIEFFNYGYDLASIQRIIKACSISRGSFYQYFNDKKDLYFEIIRLIVNRKLNALEPAINSADKMGFFNFLEKSIKLGFEYARKNPMDVKISESIFTSQTLKMDEIISFIFSQHNNQKPMPGSIEFYTKLIRKAQQKGEITPAIDPDSAAMFTKTMLETLNTSLMKQTDSNDNLGLQSEKLFYDYLSIMKTGLMAKGVSNE